MNGEGIRLSWTVVITLLGMYSTILLGVGAIYTKLDSMDSRLIRIEQRVDDTNRILLDHERRITKTEGK